MTAEFSLNTKITFITASYLKATGWYDLPSQYIRTSNWGLRKGCDFLSVAAPFCPLTSEYGTIGVPQCSSDFTFKGIFEASVAKDALEGCVILKPGSISGISNESSYCTSNVRTLGYNNSTSFLQESFGPDSRCFMAQYVHKNLKSAQTTTFIPVCHNFKCDFDEYGDIRLKIFIETQIVVCPVDGGEVKLTDCNTLLKINV